MSVLHIARGLCALNSAHMTTACWSSIIWDKYNLYRAAYKNGCHGNQVFYSRDDGLQYKRTLFSPGFSLPVYFDQFFAALCYTSLYGSHHSSQFWAGRSNGAFSSVVCLVYGDYVAPLKPYACFSSFCCSRSPLPIPFPYSPPGNRFLWLSTLVVFPHSHPTQVKNNEEQLWETS